MFYICFALLVKAMIICEKGGFMEDIRLRAISKEEFLKRTEAFLLDLDGTVYLSGTPIGDMVNTLKTLRAMGKRLVYLTNNSSKTEDEYVKLLCERGIWGEGDVVFSSATAAIGHLKANYPGKRVHMLATDAIKKHFEASDIILDEDDPQICLMAYDVTLTFEKIKAFNESLAKDTIYMATHPDVVCPTNGISMPDVGAFIQMFKMSSGRLPDIVCGKPERIMAEELERVTGIDKSKMCMVGDRLSTDIRFGNNNGIPTILVLSGEATLEDLAQSQDKPNLVLSSFNNII